MAARVQFISQLVESFAPKMLAESWDNVGLQVGSMSAQVNKVLVALDVNLDVVKEAQALGVEMIVSHHPLIFKPLKRLDFDTPQGKVLQSLINNGISVYSAHTNLDSAKQGVNQTLAELLGLSDIQVLSGDYVERLYKLVVFVPKTHTDQLFEAMCQAGAGQTGNYSHCTFRTDGVGTFSPENGTKPFIGSISQLEHVEEVRLETIVKEKDINKVVKAMLKQHPYEEVAYDLFSLENKGSVYGLGRIGRLTIPCTLNELIAKVKTELKLESVVYGGEENTPIKKVAVCGGAGMSLMHKAIFAGADVFITGDVKYHEAQDIIAQGISFIDAGHNPTEKIIVPVLANALSEALCANKCSVEVIESKVNTNPFKVSVVR